MQWLQKTQWTNTSRWHCTPNHHRLWKLNTGLQATWAMSFSTLPPESRTLVSNEIQNLLSSEKRTLDHWATVQFFFSLAQVRRLWWQLYPNSLTCLCVVALDALTPASVHSLWSYNPHKAAVLSVGCASFSSTLFPSTQLSVYMLGYSTLWTASFFGNECLWLTLHVKGVNDCLLDNCQISSLPRDYVA